MFWGPGGPQNSSGMGAPSGHPRPPVGPLRATGPAARPCPGARSRRPGPALGPRWGWGPAPAAGRSGPPARSAQPPGPWGRSAYRRAVPPVGGGPGAPPGGPAAAWPGPVGGGLGSPPPRPPGRGVVGPALRRSAGGPRWGWGPPLPVSVRVRRPCPPRPGSPSPGPYRAARLPPWAAAASSGGGRLGGGPWPPYDQPPPPAIIGLSDCGRYLAPRAIAAAQLSGRGPGASATAPAWGQGSRRAAPGGAGGRP